MRWKGALCTALWSFAFTALAMAAEPQRKEVKIVGIGAVNCSEFLQEIRGKPTVEKHFIAWMQGYMSGIIVARPPGVDEGIDLIPASFPLNAQADFVREGCFRHPDAPFSEVVEALYKRLRTISSF